MYTQNKMKGETIKGCGAMDVDEATPLLIIGIGFEP